MPTIEIKFNRADRIYRPPDIVDGRVIVNTKSGVSHQGVKIILDGTITLQPSLNSIGVIESLYKSVKPIQLLNKTVQISPPGKINPGQHEIPFHISLDKEKGGFVGSLPDTYHGAYINIMYSISADVSRSYIHKGLSATLEFILENNAGNVPWPPVQGHSVYFYITQDTQKHPLLPSIRSGGFRVVGKIMTFCALTEPIVGELTVESSAVPIRSIDIKILRIESIALNERMASETTEIQATQVADGDVCRGLPLPIYVILPRLLTCPTLSTRIFSLEFGLCVTVTFETGLPKLHASSDSTTKEWVAKETLPLRLVR